MFERLRQALEAALAAADPGGVSPKMREAVLEAKVSIGRMQEGVEETEQRLARERQQLADAERRGRLARGIQDTETAEVAERFAAKHGERVQVLQQKLEAQRTELALAEREYGGMKQQLLEYERTHPAQRASDRLETAWRSVEAAGGTRPATDVEGERLRSELDRAAKAARAEEQLEALKRKMRKP
ncbi:MAG: hypothetical protein PVF27_04435 [Gemmatimonadales bacterium]